MYLHRLDNAVLLYHIGFWGTIHHAKCRGDKRLRYVNSDPALYELANEVVTKLHQALSLELHLFMS